jgi:signal transduction histidine kinase
MFTCFNHELRTPLNGALNGLIILKPNVRKQGDKTYKIVFSSIKYLLSLVSDTLDLAAMQAGRFSMNLETVNFRECIKEVVDLINIQIDLKQDVFLIDTIAPDVPAKI